MVDLGSVDPSASDNAADAFATCIMERAALRKALRSLRDLVDQQAEDEGLWFQAIYITESYLQQELRKLHAAIEATEAA